MLPRPTCPPDHYTPQNSSNPYHDMIFPNFNKNLLYDPKVIATAKQRLKDCACMDEPEPQKHECTCPEKPECRCPEMDHCQKVRFSLYIIHSSLCNLYNCLLLLLNISYAASLQFKRRKRRKEEKRKKREAKTEEEKRKKARRKKAFKIEKKEGR